jgi:HEAT repeat protein
MSRQVAVLAACVGLACTVVWLSGCAPAKKVEVIDYAAMASAPRLLAAEDAGPMGEGALAAIVGLLSDPSPIVRAEAAQTLGTWAAVCDPAMALPALTYHDPLVRGMAQTAYTEASAYGMAPLPMESTVTEVPPPILTALAELRDPAGKVNVDKIILASQNVFRGQLNSAPEMAALAADLLARVGDEGARRVIIRIVESGEGLPLAKAARACVRDNMGLGPTLLPVAFGTGELSVRRAVMAAMVALPDPRLKALPLKGLDDPDPAVRHNAIRALGNMDGAAPIGALTAKLSQATNERFDCLRALGAIGKPAASVLRGFARKPPEPAELEVAALLSLAPNANRDDVGWISKRLSSPSERVRAAAATALGRISHPSAQAALMQAAKDNEPLVRAAAAKALGQIGTVYAARQLEGMLNDPSPLVVSLAAWGLGTTGDHDAVGALKGLVKSQKAARQGVSRLGDIRGAPALAAIEALGRIGTPEAVACLRETLASPSWMMRVAAAQALATADDRAPETIQAVERLLKDPVGLVRAQALVTLRALGKTYSPGDLQAM